MPYEFFDHQADIGIIGEGKSYEQAFQEAAKAMFEVMCDLKQVRSIKTIKINVSAVDLDALFVEWLNELLAQKDIADMLFNKFKVKIIKRGKTYSLTGTATGEKLNIAKHRLHTEVKAATYSQLKVWTEKNKHKAQCVVDV